MDTEQYEEAVRDYEKVYQTEKTKGKRAESARQNAFERFSFEHRSDSISLHLNLLPFRT